MKTGFEENMRVWFDKFDALPVLIIGDVMIDAYLNGKVERISPEAPVPVVLVSGHVYRIGGAANVALNLKSLGAAPVLCGLIGKDSAGERLIGLFEQNDLSTTGLVTDPSRPTTTKQRVMSGSHQLLRIDEETDAPASQPISELLWAKIAANLPNSKVVIFEDYDKGTISEWLIEKTISLACLLKIPVVVDPKKRNFSYYRHASWFKPNLKELCEGLNRNIDPTNRVAVEQAAQDLASKLGLETVLLTLAQHGMMLYSDKKFIWQPAHIRTIADVSGAGDTVISVAALGVGLGMDAQTILALANLAGGLVCEHVGVVPIDKYILLQEAIRYKL